MGPEPAPEGASTTHVPLVEETVRIDKQAHQTASVRVRAVLEEMPVELHETLVRETAQIDHVAVGRVVETVPQSRHVGDTLIIPVVEERLLVRKELVLVEELHVRLARSSEPVSATLMRAVVERAEGPTEDGR